MSFTPTQQCILDTLSDAQAHTRKELKSCLRDDLNSYGALHTHISRIRKLLQPHGETIVCEIVSRRICYRHVILLNTKTR